MFFRKGVNLIMAETKRQLTEEEKEIIGQGTEGMLGGAGGDKEQLAKISKMLKLKGTGFYSQYNQQGDVVEGFVTDRD